MKKYQEKIMIVLFVIALSAWMGRSYIRQLFPPKMKFASVEFTPVDSNNVTTINDLKGNVVIVSCYQTWCGSCAGETPVLNQLSTDLNSSQFKILYISDEGAEKVSMFRQRIPSDKILFMHSQKSLADLGIHVYPTTFLLNKKGEVIQTKLEGYDWLKEEDAIRKLIAE